MSRIFGRLLRQILLLFQVVRRLDSQLAKLLRQLALFLEERQPFPLLVAHLGLAFKPPPLLVVARVLFDVLEGQDRGPVLIYVLRNRLGHTLPDGCQCAWLLDNIWRHPRRKEASGERALEEQFADAPKAKLHRRGLATAQQVDGSPHEAAPARGGGLLCRKLRIRLGPWLFLVTRDGHLLDVGGGRALELALERVLGPRMRPAV
mmetsp:Transcript_3559/g.7395  ORF Transcript_3559/g.7395 Transcript_3559/m.7395 type:complete len:205 (+) Transcript_3559:479-1093(+)